ncbi:TTL3A glycylase, partial [Acromyrmex charruanus]
MCTGNQGNRKEHARDQRIGNPMVLVAPHQQASGGHIGDKKSQSNWKLPSSSVDLDRKDNSVTPYHRANHERMTHPKWTLPDTNDQSEVEITCCIFSEETTVTRHHNCCKSKKEAYWKIKQKIKNAVKKHKIFLLRDKLPKLKEALEARGWVQKYESTKIRMLPYGTAANLEAHSLGDITQADETLNERAVIFAFLRYKQPDFIWDCRNNFVEWHRGFGCNILLNKYQRSFLYEENVSDALFPRTYNPSTQQTFVEDFRLTAAAGLLKWFIRGTTVAEEILVANSEKRRVIPIVRLEFAIKKGEQPSDEEWNYFLNNHTTALHHGVGIDSSSEKSRRIRAKCFLAAVAILEKLKTIDPQYEMNDIRGIWILKPSHLCCGNGIMSHNLKDIMHKIEQKPKDYYIVQKYIGMFLFKHAARIAFNLLIELFIFQNVLLIKKTKFGIRLWYLVTCTFPLTIWLFKNNGGHRSDEAAQNHMERRRCSFELYGADFMLAEDMSVWLIEINTNPRMHPPSSRLTRRLYSNVLESLVKGEQQNGYEKVIMVFKRKFFQDGDGRADVD